MSIEEITVENWRSIGSNPSVTVKLGEITVISGANDSGKTAFLLAGYTAFVRMQKKEEYLLDRILLYEGSKHSTSIKRGTNEPAITTTSLLSNYQINQIINKILSSIQYLVIKEYINDKTSMEYAKANIIEFLNYYLSGYRYICKINNFKNKEEQISIPLDIFNGKKELIEYLSKNKPIDNSKITIQLFEGLFDGKLNESEKFIVPIDSSFNCLFISSNRDFYPDGSHSELREDEVANFKLAHNMSELVKHIQIIRSEQARISGKYDKLLECLRVILPDLIGIDTDIATGNRAQKDIFIEWDFEGTKKRQPLTRSGSGIVNSVYLVARLISDIDFAGIGFIDEPEAGLHPKLQVRFIKLLRKLSSEFSIQWVIATHSPFIMRNLKSDDKLYLFEHNGLRTTSKEIGLDNKADIFAALGAYLPDTLTAKGVLYVEGATEAEVLPILLGKAGFDCEKNGLVIVPLGGDNLYHIDPKDLKKLHSKILVIIDSDLKQAKGVSIHKKKLEYKLECGLSDVSVFLSRAFRCIENIYPVSAIAKTLGKTEDECVFGPFDEMIPGFTKHNKVSHGIKVANYMTETEAKEFPLVKAILEWWE